MPKIVTVLLFLVLMSSCTLASAVSDDSRVWAGYSLEQKKLAIAGFSDCYRTVSENKKAFAESSYQAAIHGADESLGNGNSGTLGSTLLHSLSTAPLVRSDVHGEHWEGPSGFHSGLWWRSLDDSDRQVYVQGILWCAEIPNTVTISAADMSIQQAVNTLNDWYVISDDDWKDPRSNARVDVAIVVAMQRNKLISIVGAKTRR